MPLGKDYTGSKFGHLTLLRYAQAGGAGRGARWLARCECGEIKEVIAKEVTRGRVRSCGKCEYHANLIRRGIRPRGTRNKEKSILYSRSVSKALSKGIPWELSHEEFYEINQRKCSYCGAGPNVTMRRGKVLFNHVDRIDEAQGYTPANCTPLCKRCNRLRSVSNHRDLLEFVKIVANRIQQASTIDRN